MKKISISFLIFIMILGFFLLSKEVKADSDHIHDDITYIAWESSNSLPDSAGNYYLTTDVLIDYTWDAPSGETIICLNGHGIRQTDSGMVLQVNNGGSLTITDCDNSTEHRYTVSSPRDNGAGLATVDDNLTSDYQTFVGGYITGGNGYEGAALAIWGNFTLNGGTIIGNNCAYGDGNGSIKLNTGGTFTMNGGSILHNFGRSGGALFVETGSTFIMNGGTMAYNNTSVRAGAIFTRGVTKIQGGEIYGNWGGESTIAPWGNTIEITGGSIHDNVVGHAGVNVSNDWRIGGNPRIYDNKRTDNQIYNVQISNGQKMQLVSPLADEVSLDIYFAAEDGGVFATNWLKYMKWKNPKDYFNADSSYYMFVNTDGNVQASKTDYTKITLSGGDSPDPQLDLGTLSTQITMLDNQFAAPSGKAFAGWLSSTNGFTYQPGDKVSISGATTFTAVWEDAVNVSFDTDGGSSVETQVILIGAKASLPLEPTKDGYFFVRWLYNDEEFDFDTPINEDITLVAEWIKGIDVLFDSNGGTDVETQNVKPGLQASVPKKPKKDGFTFICWLYNDVEFDFSTPITESITLVAKWERGVDYLFDFEDGMPDGWTSSGDYSWEAVSEGESTPIYSGKMAYAIQWDYDGQAVLLTSEISLEGALTASFSFYYINVDWAGDTDTLVVEYFGIDDDWHQIVEITDSHSSWQYFECDLPIDAYGSNFKLRFKAHSGYGYGVGLDNINLIAALPEVAAHNWSYSASGNTITATCADEECELGAQTATLTVQDQAYSGEAVVAEAVKSDGWTVDNGLPTVFNITYSGNIDVGTYTATLTINDAVATQEFTISKASLTIKAVDEDLIYGDLAPSYKISYDGFVLEEDEEVLSGELSFTCSYQQFDNVGEYIITPSGLTSDNYAITFDTGKLTVSSKELTVVAENKEIVYGESDPEFTYQITGLVNNDSVSGKLARADGTNVGEYEIGQGTLAAGSNYTINYISANLTINKASLTIKALDKNIVYGDEVPLYQVSYDGFVLEEDEKVLSGELSFTCSYQQYDNVGEYVITPSGLTSDNYNIIFDTGKLTISQREVGLEWSNTSLDYNGKAQIPDINLTNTVNNDVINFVLIGDAIDAGTHVAEVESLTGDKVSNYKLPSVTTQEFIINQIAATITITGNNNTYDYDGEEHNVSGFVAEADTELFDVDKDITFVGEALASRTNAGTANMGLVASMFSNSNANFGEVTFIITDGYVTINALDAIIITKPVGTNLAYNEENQPLVSAGEVDGGEFVYALGNNLLDAPEEGYSNQIPEGSDANSYYVWYKVLGDENHNDLAPKCIKVIIYEPEWLIIEGVLYEKDGKTPLEGAILTLTKGNQKVDNIISDDSGQYLFIVPKGIYNIVLEYEDTKDTILVTLFDNVEKDITLSNNKTESTLVVNTLEEEFNIAVGGLEKEAYDIRENEGLTSEQTVSVTMTVEVKTEETAAYSDVIAGSALDKDFNFFDITVEKTIDSLTSLLAETSNVLEIVVPYPVKGRKNISVVSYHGDKVVSFIESDTKENGTFRADSENNLIYIYSNSFSTYAIGYTPYYKLDGKVTLGSFEGSTTIVLKNIDNDKEYVYEDIAVGKINFTDIPKGRYQMTITWVDGAENTLTVPLTIGNVAKEVASEEENIKADVNFEADLETTDEVISYSGEINNYMFVSTNKAKPVLRMRKKELEELKKPVKR